MSPSQLAALWRANRGQLADAYRDRQLALAAARPAHMKLELTNYCNLACTMCPHRLMQRAVGYMTPALFRKIIDDAAPELEFAYLHHLGESLFHGRIGGFIAYARAAGVATGLSTNATFLTPAKARTLLEAGLDFLVISIDGASPASYERLRVGADFATTIRRVREFFELEARVPHHTTTVVQMIASDENRDEVEAFARMWNGRVMIKEARDWAGQVPLGLAPPPARLPPCRMPWTEMTVLWDGAVVPCANVFEREHLLGDLSVQTVDEVWNGAPMRALRQAHAAEQVDAVPVCRSCPRHRLERESFIAVDHLRQRTEHYARGESAVRPGLS